MFTKVLITEGCVFIFLELTYKHISLLLDFLLSSSSRLFHSTSYKEELWYRHVMQTSHTYSTPKFTFRELSKKERKIFILHICLHTHFCDARSWLSEPAYETDQGMVVMPVVFKACQKLILYILHITSSFEKLGFLPPNSAQHST